MTSWQGGRWATEVCPKSSLWMAKWGLTGAYISQGPAVSITGHLLFYLYLFWKPPDHVEASGSDSLSPNSLYSFSFNCPGRFAYSLGCICASRQSVMQTLLRYGIYVNTKKLEDQNSDHIPAIPPWAWEAWLWLRRKGKGCDNEQGLLYSKHDKYTLWLA